MTEVERVRTGGEKYSSATENHVRTLAFSPLICVICEICGFKFGVLRE